jgi:uncharacterized membrane protein YqiK
MVWVILAVVVVIAVAVLAWLWARMLRTQRLQEALGPEDTPADAELRERELAGNDKRRFARRTDG